MTKKQSVQQQLTAGPNAIGFDYQFYYFMYLALDLSHGDSIGFEVRDDVHIQKNDGSVILFQGKHSIQTNTSGEVQNLTALDLDLWKTMSNWVSMIEAESDRYAFLVKNSFVLFTNKNENFNEFITALSIFKVDGDYSIVALKLRELAKKTTDKIIKKYLKHILGLKVKEAKIFLSKLTVETGVDDIITKIKNRLMKTARIAAIADAIFDSLYTSMQTAKYLDIKDRSKFEISFDDFNNRFGRCFLVAFKERALPKRDFPILLPEDLETQTFIKQLIDIGEISPGSKQVITYTEQMLKVLNNFSCWVEENLLFPHESEKCDSDAIFLWQNKFNSKYREINKKLASGTAIVDLEEDIRAAALDIIDYLREQNLDILEGKLGIDFSNGHYYTLSDKLRLGWHLDWQNKYQNS
ncbi:ABC-three component system protein [Pedobacter gandavensis]|uniref:ABC-three component system protein n=1 Tax=Pedobacter gandavensis TaxID=2679963 RepID=UPI00292DF50A|nr:ABC-three component system protein [Pedobacter gandavensis]